MTAEETKEILKRYNAGQCTDLEKTIIEETFIRFNEGDLNLSQNRIEEIGKSIFKNLPGNEPIQKSVKLWPGLGAAVAIIALVISTWMYHQREDLPTVNAQAQDIKPGGNRATLMLANGKIINLSDAKTGIIIDAKKLAYNDGTAITGAVSNNSELQVLQIPRGGQYQITLSDGTKVFLNADSKLTFPSTFDQGTQRKVTLTGEAYFQVAKDKKKPFVVSTGQQNVFVLGTHFNINAYSAEIKTTLLEGSVKITSTNKLNSAILKPGEQAINGIEGLRIKQADIDLEMAWRNGKTEFRDADLKTIMGMLERWYNIETIYPANIPDAKFSGSVSRTRNISEILELLESTGEVHFKIKGRRVEILK